MAWLISKALMENFENSHSSLVQAGESSEGISSDGEPSVPSSETPTPQAYLSPDRMTDFSRLSRSGMTFAPLTASRGEDVLMWCLEGSRAKTSAQPGEVQESRASGRDSGVKWPASLAKYDHDSRSWRTHQYSLLGGLIEFSETWPRWGTMRGGECWAQSMPVRHTSGNGSGLWPTPAASDSKQRHTPRSTQRRLEIGKQIGLEAAVGIQESRNMWPTPCASEGLDCGTNWESLAAVDRGGRIARRIASTGGPETRQTTHAQLNPAWVEWLMGWPIGWTDLKPLGTDRFQQWRHSHGGC
jgi:hypothetical protein